MKILHLTSSNRGGAGIAASRLNKALRQEGIKSELYFSNGVKSILDSEFPIPRNLGIQFISSSLTFTQNKFIQKDYGLATPLSLNIFRSKNIRVENYDTVNIHSTFNILNNKSIKYIIANAKKVVFTLHDQRLFTGGCHYSLDCNHFLNSCDMCPQVYDFAKKLILKQFESSKSLFQNKDNVYIVTPSKWLKETAERSMILRNKKVFHIYNPIPEGLKDNVTKIHRESEIEKKRVIGFISANINNPNKGLIILKRALEMIDIKLRRNFKLIIVGSGELRDKSFSNDIEVEHRKDISVNQIQSVYGELDLLVVPSIIDNSPNVIGEALMSGTAVIGSDSGGIGELLCKFNLKTFKTNSATDLCLALTKFDWNYDREIISKKALDTFSFSVIAKEYLKVYSIL